MIELYARHSEAYIRNTVAQLHAKNFTRTLETRGDGPCCVLFVSLLSFEESPLSDRSGAQLLKDFVTLDHSSKLRRSFSESARHTEGKLSSLSLSHKFLGNLIKIYDGNLISTSLRLHVQRDDICTDNLQRSTCRRGGAQSARSANLYSCCQ